PLSHPRPNPPPGPPRRHPLPHLPARPRRRLPRLHRPPGRIPRKHHPRHAPPPLGARPGPRHRPTHLPLRPAHAALRCRSLARRRDLAIGALSYAAIVLSHFMVAFYFTPLLAGFLLFTAKRAAWRPLALGLLLGVGLSAYVWMPIVFEGQYVQLERTTEGMFA